MIHPVFIRYFFEGDIASTIAPVWQTLRAACPGSRRLIFPCVSEL